MKKRVLSALLALCLTLSLAGAAFAENETPVSSSSSAASESVAATEPESKAAAASDSTSGESKAESEPEEETTSTETPAASDVTKEEQEETAASEATPAPTEDPEAEVTEKAEADGSVEYTAALESDGQTMNVIVTAPDGAFAKDVQPELSVTMLTAENELNDVADKLDTAEVQYEGFAALDITFTDKATGEEIEPAKEVAVRIELPQAIVDSGIDLNTLAVQHLEEDENGDVQKVTEVANLDNGITLSEEAAAAANEAAGVAPMSDMPAEEATAGDAAETPAAVAEFSVDGFSTFTLTWQKNYGDSYHFKITIHYVDENGTEIQGPNQYNRGFGNGDIITFADYAGPIEGYTYQAAHYQAIDGAVITSMNAEQKWHDAWIGGYNTYDITFYNGNDPVLTNDNSNSASDFSDPKDRDIYLVYKQDSGSQGGGNQGDTGTVTENATVTTSKTAVLKTDNSGNYDLTLSISGDRGNKTKKQAVDVLFVLDLSNSMATGWGDYNTRLDAAREAIAQIAGYGDYNGLSDNENLSVKYSLVGFGGGNSSSQNPKQDAGVRQTWTDDASKIYNAVPDEIYYNDWNHGSSNYYGGGTNYEAGIVTGKELLDDPGHRSGAQTVVIFITDGNPGYYYNYNGGTAGSSNPGSGYNENALSNAVDELETLNTNYFFLVGVTNSISSKVFQDMEDAVAVPAENKDSVTADSPQALIDAFKNIQQQITFFAATDVTITDPLSQYADIVLNANEKAEFTVTVTRTELKDEEGKVTSEAKTWEVKVTAGEKVEFQDRNGKNVTVTPAYNNGTITLTFPHSTGETPGYELEPGYTYSISTVIAPSDKAKRDYATSKEYPETPDDDTGTHSIPDEENNYSKDKGFWSNDNDNAKVTFTANGEDGSQAFPRPVIQVTESTGSLQIVKDVQGIDGDVTSVVGNTTFTFQLEKVIKVEGSSDEYTRDGTFTDSTLGFTGGVKEGITITGEGESSVISGLPEGWYRITETNTGTVDANSDYEFVSNNGPVVVQVTEANTSTAPAEATIINTYKHKDKTLTVIKTITGNMAYDQDTFQFTLSLTKDGSPYNLTGNLPDGVDKVDGENGQYTFSLKAAVGSNQVVFTLPHGVSATVTETLTDDYEESSRQYQTGATTTLPAFDNNNTETFEMTSNRTFEFQNKKEIVTPPTGLERNDKPYALMISVAVLAGMALVGGVVVRRRRRWME